MTRSDTEKGAFPRWATHRSVLLCYCWIFVAVCRPVLSKSCCHMNVHRLFRDCSSRGWTSVLSREFPSDTRGINLSFNNISEVRNQAFTNLSMLEFLDLSNNVIRTLQSAAFQGLSHLMSLNLSQNRLLLSPKVWTPKLFEPLVNLRTLNIKGTIGEFREWYLRTMHIKGTTREWHGIDAAFGKLTNLTKLYLDFPMRFAFDKGFQSLTKLTTISTQGSGTYCSVIYLTQTTFRSLKDVPVRELRVTNCNILSIEPGSFDPLTSLQILDLSYNHELGLQRALQSLHSFGGRNMTEINLAMVNGKAFEITDIVLSSDDIGKLADICVRFVDMSMNSISLFRDLGVHSMWIDCLEKLNVSGHSLQNFPSSMLTTLSISKSLKCLDFSHENVLDSYNSGNHPQVYEDLSENVTLPPNLSWLSFSSCWHCFDMNKEITFSFTENLRHLGIASVKIGEFTGQRFKGFYNLTSIDMSGNGLTDFPTEVFRNNKQLRTVNLANNKLQHLPSKDLDVTYRFEELDFSANVFTHLESDDIKLIDNWLENSPSMKLLFGNNPLQCTCDTLLFTRWIIRMEGNIDTPDNYTCLVPNGTRVPFPAFRKQLTDFAVQCVSHTYLTISVVGVLALVLLVLLLAGTYRYRLNLRYWIYTKLMPPENMFVDREYAYDAFVAYTSDDYEWVIRKLRPNMELVEGPIRLCVHDRDFIPGKPIHENIVDKMKESRKILLIISQGFLESRFGPLEIEYAGMKSLEEGRDDRIVCVLMEDIPVRKMPRALRNLWHKITFLKWSDNAELEVIFWRNLKIALTPVGE